MGVAEPAMHGAMPALSRLLSGVSLSAFFENYWETSPLFVARTGTFDDIIALPELDRFLGRTDIRHPTLRLVRDGSELSLNDYTRELKLGSHVSHDLIDNEKLFTLFHEGATIVLQFLQNNIVRFGRFSNDLENEIGCNIHGSCFITPPQAQGFTAHYDTYSFFVLQLFGSKQWRLYGRTSKAPIREDRDADFPFVETTPQGEYTLRVGDILYVPRGFYHDATTMSEPSIHLTLGMFVPTWLDIVRAALKDIEGQPELRANPPYLGATGITHIGTDEYNAISHAVHAHLDLQRGFDLIKEEHRARRVDARQGRLRDSLLASALSTSSSLSVQDALALRIGVEDNAIELEFADKRLRFPAWAEPSLRQMLALEAFTPAAISGELDEESALLLCRTLLEEGFLTYCGD